MDRVGRLFGSTLEGIVEWLCIGALLATKIASKDLLALVFRRSLSARALLY